MAKRITLLNLIKAGLLEDGEKLECCFTKSGKVYIGRLNADGSISYDSKRFKTPSGWGKHLAGTSRESGSSNGWTDISARGKKLSEYRQLLSQTKSTKAHKQPPESDSKAEASSSVPEGSKTTSDTFATERKGNTASDLLKRIVALSPSGFEKLVGEFLKAKGFAKVKITKFHHDEGIDGECELSFIDVKVAFQAKRYQPQKSVGIDPVQRLRGSLEGRYNRGVFVTTSNFTSSAKGWVKEVNAPIRLVDGEELVQEMIDRNLGVKTIPVVEHQIDESFFNRLTKE